MSATHRPPPSRADVQHPRAGAELFLSDVSHAVSDAEIALRLGDEVYERTVANVFGIPRDKQSFLVKLLITGAALSVAGDYLSRLPHPHPDRTDTVLGASVLLTAVRGVAGAPTRGAHGAGAIITLAVIAGGARALAQRSARDVRAAAHSAGARYAHRPAGRLIPNA